MATKKRGKDPFREIQNCLQKRDYKSALGWFRALLEKEKTNTQIRLRYADTLVLAGSKNEAIKQYRVVADELAESGFMIRAIAINKKIVQLDPSQTDVHQKLAAMNDARAKGRSAAMAKLASAITSDPVSDASSPPPSPPPGSPEQTASPPQTLEPTMSLEDSLAMEFGGSTGTEPAGESDEPARAVEASTPSTPVSKPDSEEERVEPTEETTAEAAELSVEEEDVLEPVKEAPPVASPADPTEEEVEVVLDPTPPPGMEAGGEVQDFELVESKTESEEVELQFESADDVPSFSEDVPSLESEEASADEVLQTASASAEEDEEGPDIQFEIEVEPEAAADGKASLVGIIGEDIDALIDSIIDDVGSSAASSAPPPQSTESPGGIPLFSQLTMQEFIDVAVVLDRRSVKGGTVIVREGEPGDSMFIVSTGQVDATREENGRSVKVATFSDGDFFGEMAVLSGEPRTATVTAVKSTELLELSRDNLLQIFSKHPEVEAKIRLAYDERASSS